MSTHFEGEGNIGSDPQVKVFPTTDNSPPRGILRLNVFFDNPVSVGDGRFEDRGGFWAPVELSRDAESCEHWAYLYQRGMRVMVTGRMVKEEWDGANGEKRSAMKVRARSVGILPFRIDQVTMVPTTGASRREVDSQPAPQQQPIPQPADTDAFDDDIPF